MSGDQEDKDADKAALADAPSSQLTQSVTNSLVLQRTTANRKVSLHFNIHHIKSLSLYPHYGRQAEYSTAGCSVLS